MKNLKVGDFEIYLLQEALKHYRTLIAQTVFSSKSIITKEYVEMMITQLENKLTENTIKAKIKALNEN